MSASPPPLVLVAEGSDTVREVLLRQLGDRGYDVAVAGDGETALARVAERRPDAILLDHELPGLSGMEVLDRLRADDALAAVPVIMLTHDTDRAELVGALNRGAHDYLLKPFDPAELDARVTAALRVKALHDALLEANRRLAAQALTDDLTGLANRRAGAHELERAVALAVRHGHVLGARPRRRRPLQADQRHLRPPGRRPGARRGRAAAGERGARRRRAGPLGRRRVRRDPARHRPRRRAARRRAAARRRRGRARRGRGRRGRRSRSPSAGRTGRATRRTTCSPAPTAPSTRRRTRGAARSAPRL